MSFVIYVTCNYNCTIVIAVSQIIQLTANIILSQRPHPTEETMHSCLLITSCIAIELLFWQDLPDNCNDSVFSQIKTPSPYCHSYSFTKLRICWLVVVPHLGRFRKRSPKKHAFKAICCVTTIKHHKLYILL